MDFNRLELFDQRLQFRTRLEIHFLQGGLRLAESVLALGHFSKLADGDRGLAARRTRRYFAAIFLLLNEGRNAVAATVEASATFEGEGRRRTQYGSKAK